MLVCALLASAFSRADLLLTPEVESESLSTHLLILRDPEGRLTTEQAYTAFRTGRGEPCRQSWPQFGFTSDTVWVRFELRSALAVDGTWLVELRTARIDELDWYVYRRDGLSCALRSGTQRPRPPLLLDHKFPVLPLALVPGEAVEVLIRVRSQTSMHLPLRVWSPVHFGEAQAKGESLFAAFFGYMAALLLISLVLSLFTRHFGFVIYSLALLGLVGNYVMTTGYYAWLALPAVPWVSHQGTLLAAESSLVLLLIYLRYFLELPTVLTRFDRWCVRPLIIATLFLAIPQLASPYRVGVQIMLLKALCVGSFSMGVGLFFWFQGNRFARFYVLGWLGFWLTFAMLVLQLKGILPMLTLPELPMLVFMATSMTFFFLALAERMREVRRRADAATAQILDLECQVNRGLQEQTRQQQVLIRDLHDGIGGLTANLGILSELGRREAPDEKTRDFFQQISDLASEGASEVRGLMNSMETRNVSWADFIVECRRQGEMRFPPHGIAFTLLIEGDPPLDDGPGMLPGIDLLRICKEAFTNVVKHAQARKVEVVLQFEAAWFRMIVRDDGKGLGAAPGAGRGLTGMEARIRDWGGRMERLAGEGTALLFEVPLPITPPAEQDLMKG